MFTALLRNPLCRRLHLGIILGVSLFAPALLFTVHAVQSHSAAVEALEDRLARRAAILAEHSARVFGTYDLVFDNVEHMLGEVDEPERSRRLAEIAARTNFTASIVVLNSSGQVVSSSNGPRAIGGSRAEREYFTAAVAKAGKAVSGQITGLFNTERLFGLSRRLSDGNVVAALVFTRYFENVFSTVAGQDGLQGVVTLYRDDGIQLARYPMRDPPLNLPPGSAGLMQMIPAERGLYRVERPLGGGGARAYAFEKVPDNPVYITYGVDIAEAMAPWWDDMVVSGMLAVATAALLVGLTLVAMRRVEQSRRAEAALQQAVAARGTEVVAAIRDREAALRMAERAHNAKAHFLAAASHDLRQPIQALRLFLDVLGGRLHEEENLRILGHASKALRGAEDLLSALLDVSTLDAGMVQAAPRPVRLAEILDGLAAEFTSQAEGRLELRYVRTAAWVETDPVLLARLLRNLLANALRYTERGRVILGCRHVAGGVRVEVWDSGRGIPADKLEAVFEDFVQLGNPERDRTKGLGLGLAVVRRMAVLLRHPIDVRSWEGKGTVFGVRLPACAPERCIPCEAAASPD